ncbi:MAG: prephenate dehydrogenase/arogenate dehydrogenase family protein [Thaumarchaeota archaeon]|nr:prephenate dehydrogenase/arogenate dehydrogenase family protein [Nitrososphaerota archaeon]
MKVAVLGSSGGMGSFFVRYFLARGDTVRGSDIGKKASKKEEVPKKGFSFHGSNSEAARGCDLTMIASPMDDTLDIAKEVVKVLKRGSTLVEITSVKGNILPDLRKIVGDGVTLLSIHPLFGPALETTDGMKIAVIAGKKGDGSEAKLAKKLFPESRLIPMTEKQHDEAMAVVLSLTHLLNIVYAKTVAHYLSPEEFMKVSTPNSSMQLTLAEAVLAQDPKLSYSIQVGNVYSARIAREASRELKRVLAMLEQSDWVTFKDYLSGLSERYKSDERAGAVIREIYSAAENAT